MMKKLLYLCLCFSVFGRLAAQTDTAVINDISRFQKDLINEYTDPQQSPLSAEAKKKFKGIHFFPVSQSYIVTATFTRTPDAKAFNMPTSGKETSQYVKYGEASFMLFEKSYKLNVYQSIELVKQKGYENYLFIPFRDSTSGFETYGGGRYIDLTIPEGNTILINFNKAYHPYCAYTEGYNCPVPPRVNTLPLKINAGVKY
jgi:uncharacterized protein (DUF1684 family)